jgi:hypothetical protein
MAVPLRRKKNAVRFPVSHPQDKNIKSILKTEAVFFLRRSNRRVVLPY